MDADAKQDAATILDILIAEGLAASMLDDSAPGVPEGTFEVRVPAADVTRAEALIAENPLPDDVRKVDISSTLDLETVFQALDAMAEVEALEIKNLLEANGIAAIIVGDSVLPNLGFQVRVARSQAIESRRLIAEAQLAGSAAAEEAELESEAGGAEGR